MRGWGRREGAGHFEPVAVEGRRPPGLAGGAGVPGADAGAAGDAAELVRDFDGTQVNHAALQLGTLHIFEALRDLGPGSLDKKLGGDCGAFARLVNALARASRETMQLQKYREACAQARAALQGVKGPEPEAQRKRDARDRAQVDEILGLAAASQRRKEPGACSSRPGSSARNALSPGRH